VPQRRCVARELLVARADRERIVATGAVLVLVTRVACAIVVAGEPLVEEQHVAELDLLFALRIVGELERGHRQLRLLRRARNGCSPGSLRGAGAFRGALLLLTTNQRDETGGENQRERARLH